MNTIESKLMDVLEAYNYKIFHTENYENGDFRGYRAYSPKGYTRYLFTYDRWAKSIRIGKMNDGFLTSSHKEWMLEDKFNEILRLRD